MATSSVSSTSNGNSLVLALGTGSGVDIKALAEGLVNAEKQPKAEAIQRAIDKNKARITAYEVVARAVDQIKLALDALAQPTAFANFNTTSTQPSAVSIRGSAGAMSGQHDVVVTRLATPQRSVGVGVGAPLTMGTPAGTGAATIEILVGYPPRDPADPITRVLSVVAADTKPESIIQAINDQGWPVRASLVQMTDGADGEVRIVLTGQTGEAQQFSANIVDDGGVSLADFSITQPAVDAKLTVNGVTDIIRSSNTVEGVIPGATLTLTSVTSGGPAVLGLSRDTAPVKEKIRQLVNSYNDLQAIIDAAKDPRSEVEQLGGSLVGDNTIRGIRDRIRDILMPTSGSSAGTVTDNSGVVTGFEASGSSRLSGLRDLGVMIDVDGTMKFTTIKAFDPLNPNAQLLKVDDESALDAQLSTAFDEVAALFQGKNGKPGIAVDMADLISGNGRYMDTSFTPSSPAKMIVATQRNARGYVQGDTDRMQALEDRMKALLERYMRQFAIMDSLVGQSKSVQTGIENSFKGMSNSK